MLWNEISTDLSYFLIFLTGIVVVSLPLNIYHLCKILKRKKLYSYEYLKIELFIINLLITIFVIPYYYLKELKFFSNNLTLCNVLFALTDFVIIFYQYFLMLVAIDRFLFICTKLEYNTRILMLFYNGIIFLLSTPSIARLTSDSCCMIGRNGSKLNIKICHNNDNSSRTKNFLLDLYYYYVGVIIILIWIVMVILYSWIAKVVYNNFKNSSYLRQDEQNVIGKSNFLTKNEKKELLKSNDFMKAKKPGEKSQFKCFLMTNHWKATKMFMKVCKLHLKKNT
jgi:hypothetical protein